MCKYSLLQIISPYSFFILLLKVTPCAIALYDYEPQETGYVRQKKNEFFYLTFTCIHKSLDNIIFLYPVSPFILIAVI